MSTHTKQSWYTKSIAHGTQSIIIHEQTGETIAVVYDPKNAPMIEAAPALLEALRAAYNYLHARELGAAAKQLEADIRSTIALAEGKE